MNKITQAYEKACRCGSFSISSYGRYTNGDVKYGEYKIEGYYVVFIAYDGERVVAAGLQEKTEAEDLVRDLNKAGSVELCDKILRK